MRQVRPGSDGPVSVNVLFVTTTVTGNGEGAGAVKFAARSAARGPTQQTNSCRVRAVTNTFVNKQFLLRVRNTL